MSFEAPKVGLVPIKIENSRSLREFLWAVSNLFRNTSFPTIGENTVRGGTFSRILAVDDEIVKERCYLFVNHNSIRIFFVQI
jgi:hypothetical protein